MERANISVALVVPEFKQVFGLTEADRGMLNSAFFWSYAFLQIPAGWLIDRYGVKFPYAIGFFAWSVLSAITPLCSSVSQLLALRFLLGVSESVVLPASMRWIRFNFQEKERGLAVGLLMTGTKIGPAIGAPITAALISLYDGASCLWFWVWDRFCGWRPG